MAAIRPRAAGIIVQAAFRGAQAPLPTFQCRTRLTCQSLGRSFGAAAGRKSKRSPAASTLSKAVAAAPLVQTNSPAIAAVPSSGATWNNLSKPPPSLQRLQIAEAERDAIVKTGRREGPLAAYEQMVSKQVLASDSAQLKCATALQSLWDTLKKHSAQHADWRSAHQIWQDKHATWKEAADQHAANQQNASSNQPDRLSDKGVEPAQLVEFPSEPPEPIQPLLDTHGCYIWGSVGGGKSLLMDLFVDSSGQCSELDFKVGRIHFHKFMQNVHKELHDLRAAGVERTTKEVARRLASEVQLLAFDEFQITNIADALIIETLFDHLFAEGVVVLMTSNRPIEELYKDGLNHHLAIPQFLALLTRMCVSIHELAAKRDFRAPEAVGIDSSALSASGPWRDFIHKADLARPGSDHGNLPAAEANVEACLRAAFQEASGSATGTPATVPLAWGRSMAIDEAANGVGRFTFSQLCSEPTEIGALGADDYLQLAEHFHTLVVADVPRFSAGKHNEARRFTNLVDCIYERHARLVISADAPLDKLLADVEKLTEFEPSPVGGAKRPAGPPPSLFTSEPASASPLAAIGAQSSGKAGAADDDTATGANVAGVMAGAVASLQEGGFAARRAVSRLVHMQSQEYLTVHRQQRLSS